MNNTEMVSKKIHVEFLRIVACFFVIFNHTGTNGFFLFSLCSPNDVGYWVYSFLSVFCKFSVPLFLAISGALLLPKEESIKTVFTKRVFRIGIVLVLASLAYYAGDVGIGNIRIKSFLGDMYTSEHKFHLWYLYAFIPFLMSLPLLRPIVKSLKNKYFLYLFICNIIFTAILPLFDFFVSKGDYAHNSKLNMDWIMSRAIIYPSIGYYIENRMDVVRAKKYIPYIWIVDIVTILLSCYATYYRADIMGICNEGVSQTFHNTFVLINVVTIYITAKCMFSTVKLNSFFEKIIRSIGTCTFGIYLVHVAVLEFFNKNDVISFFRDLMGINSMLSCFICCFAIMLISYAITWILKKIPLVNKLI